MSKKRKSAYAKAPQSGRPAAAAAPQAVRATTSTPAAPATSPAVASGAPEAARAAASRPVLHLVRVTIEAESPLSFGSGDVSVKETTSKGRDGKDVTETITETALARDAYGLPTIPGATLQGVLRSLADDGSSAFERAFGWAQGDEGAAAKLTVGFARVHDSHDKAVAGVVTTESQITTILDDPILSELLRSDPLRRDHVKLNDRHVVDRRAKFTRLAAPVGARFSFELALWSAAEDAAEDGAYLCDLVGLLNHPALRLGGGGGRGYGRVKVVRASYARPALMTPDDLKRLRELRRDPPSAPFSIGFSPAQFAARATIAVVTLNPVGPWRIGGDGPAATELTNGERDNRGEWTRDVTLDLRGARPAGGDDETHAAVARKDGDIARPAREPRIHWFAGSGAWRQPTADTPFDDNPFAVPGSAVRGPLAHRALFHWNRARGRFVDADAWSRLGAEQRDVDLRKYQEWGVRPPELSGLFGAPKERQATDARAARLLVDDGKAAEVRFIQGVDHNSIDRFTGGVREGFLYAEEVLIGGVVSLRLVILPPERNLTQTQADWPDDVRDAFLAALRDLCRGRLALGAKSMGFFTGDVAWGGSDADKWRQAWDEAKAAKVGGQAA